jgi:hypothetical protein
VTEMKFAKRTDLIIIAAVVAACALAWFGYKAIFSGQTKKAEVYCYGQLAATVNLDESRDYTFSIPQNRNVVFHVIVRIKSASRQGNSA